MTLFLTLLASWVVAGFIVQILARIFLRNVKLGVGNHSDYLAGYLTGITNLKMYYYTTGEIPSTNWLDKVKHSILNSREKLEATIENVPVKQ